MEDCQYEFGLVGASSRDFGLKGAIREEFGADSGPGLAELLSFTIVPQCGPTMSLLRFDWHLR